MATLILILFCFYRLVLTGHGVDPGTCILFPVVVGVEILLEVAIYNIYKTLKSKEKQ